MFCRSPLLQFAGEATHSHYFSSVHGAIETGWREADRIIDYHRIPNVSIPRTRFTNIRIEKSIDVLVLGAGAAGIGAARKLNESKLSFLVLEADECVGGRLRTCHLNNIEPMLKEQVLIDAGGQWLHGRKNPLYNYAKDKGLLMFDKSQQDNGIFVREDGVPISKTLAEEVEDLVDDILEDCEEFYEEDRDKYPDNLNVYLDERFEQKIKQKDPVMKMQARQLLDWNKRVIAADNAAPDLFKLSAKQWGRFEHVGGKLEYISVRGGMGNLLNSIANEVATDHFQFHKLVQKIHWTAELVLPGETSRKILIKCSDGSLYAASHVIATFSLGVLKHDSKSLFVPKLPQRHQRAVEKMGFGPLTKIFIQFDNSWLKNEAGGQLIFREEDYTGAPWTRYISGFERLMSGHVENTFQGWVIGKGAVDVERLSDSQVHKDLITLFQQFLGQSPPYPKRYFISRWNSNPLTRGAYSYASAQCDRENITPDDLAEPICQRHLYEIFHLEEIAAKKQKKRTDKVRPLILFAGEACHQYYYSTAHGAYLSGENQAKRILTYSRRNKTDWLQEAPDIVDYIDFLLGVDDLKDVNAIQILEELMEYF